MFNCYILKIFVMKFKLILIVLLVNHLAIRAQSKVLYKTVGTDSLFMEIYSPKVSNNTIKPVMVFFFGGGWTSGNLDQFRPHAEYFAKRGSVTALVDYRVMSRNGTSPFACLRDAKSAIRYLRTHAESLGIDPEKLIAAGGSAGGHLAAALAVIDGYNESTDDPAVDCNPNALVLFNPVLDNGPGGYGYNRIGNEYLHFSPLHNLRKGIPPTIIFLGTEDHLIPVETVKYYQRVMQKLGSRCDLHLYEGQDHGFFNYKNFEYYQKTVLEADLFLQSLGYLEEQPKIKIE